jgi:HPt (histidine-containing phosphotransfer) domain-containing protein
LTGLDAIYRQALPGRIAELESARADGGAASADAIRRIAHSLRGSGGTYGYPPISEAAAALESAPADLFDERLDQLIALLEAVAAGAGESGPVAPGIAESGRTESGAAEPGGAG